MSAKRNNGRGKRYTTAEKAKVVKFVKDYNAKHGRGGQSRAADEFDISQLTIASWLRSKHLSNAAGKASSTKGVPAKASLPQKVKALIEVCDQLRDKEGELDRLRAEYESIRASILGDL